jgi:acetoin utilization deacetylase AcuC-like enzyme
LEPVIAVALFTHPACFGHRTPPGHPESVDRLRAVLAGLEGEAFAGLDRRSAPLAERADLERVHRRGYIDLIAASEPGDPEDWIALDPDTAMSTGSHEAALRAAGAVCAAVDGAVAGEFTRAFCAVRPPGHHAERERAMGFCLFNSIAVAAARARDVHGLARVAVVDFDVHHGNGTQALAYERSELFFASIHEGGIYPGTGSAEDTGPADNVVNVPAPHGCDGPRWRALVAREILPRLDAFAPELILVSAGFDGHRADPLAGLRLEAEDFGQVTADLVAIAEAHAGGRLVSTLEGGYDLPALAASAAAHVRAMMNG